MEELNRFVVEEFVELVEIFDDKDENETAKVKSNPSVEITKIFESENLWKRDGNAIADLDERETIDNRPDLENIIEEKLSAIRESLEYELPKDPRINKPKTKLPILLKRIEPYNIETPRVVRRSVFERLGREDFVSTIRRTGRDLVIKFGSIDPCRGLSIMINVGVGFDESLIGERAASWAENSSNCREFVGHSKTLHGDLDGAPFTVVNARRTIEFEWYQAPDLYAKRVQIQAIVVPSRGHTPDFAPERVEFGRDFIRRQVLGVDLVTKTLTVRSDDDRTFVCNFEFRRRSRRYR